MTLSAGFRCSRAGQVGVRCEPLHQRSRLSWEWQEAVPGCSRARASALLLLTRPAVWQGPLCSTFLPVGSSLSQQATLGNGTNLAALAAWLPGARCLGPMQLAALHALQTTRRRQHRPPARSCRQLQLWTQPCRSQS